MTVFLYARHGDIGGCGQNVGEEERVGCINVSNSVFAVLDDDHSMSKTHLCVFTFF